MGKPFSYYVIYPNNDGSSQALRGGRGVDSVHNTEEGARAALRRAETQGRGPTTKGKPRFIGPVFRTVQGPFVPCA